MEITKEELTNIIKEELEAVLDEKRKKRKKAGTESSKESSLKDWFGRKGAKGTVARRHHRGHAPGHLRRLGDAAPHERRVSPSA